MKTNILSKIHDDCLKTVTSRVLTRFSFDLAQRPSFFLAKVTQFKMTYHQEKHTSKIHDNCFKNVAAGFLFDPK